MAQRSTCGVSGMLGFFIYHLYLFYHIPTLHASSRRFRTLTNILYRCILIELITNNYLFAGSTDTEQLDLIFRVFGTPSDDSWPGVTQLPGWAGVEKKKSKYPSQDLDDAFSLYIPALYQFYYCAYLISSSLSPEALDLAKKLLSLDPKKRISSFDALQHPWFWTAPLPCSPQYVMYILFSCPKSY